MDADTKRRIDNARDALVGKVPDPKGQVEQITIALTYKFMDDMDLQAIRFGGKRRFFAGDFKEYAWSKLMDPSIGAQRMLHLYSNGIERMSDNSGAASLFRTIFANAFLPYNDPSTLQQFLRIINEFEYGNSESLGDAYEYLTSIMGSQGDAGQFRTPRHIIDFIVDIVDPQHGERILDPACGTGGFLISAYKHIIAANSNADGTTRLTPDQLKKLSDKLAGFDIDPGMVRIALLNMYLHELVDPHILEYDTLTSEAHWNDDADVIIANPPFMTPKGGIRPHSRFSVQSKRSEVLFVDYMAEHLTSSGRAGIIVPEGIIFQTQNAHKQLRKMLVDEYLAAVISLPGGVFNPYSGVKTSILILDKALARKSDSIGFFKVNNDGYDPGAQRRPIDQNDLPQVRTEVQEYIRRTRAGEPTIDWKPATGQVVRRDKIAADGEYNLSGERYRVRTVRSTKWQMVRLGDVAEVRSGNPAPQEDRHFLNGNLPFIRTSDVGAVHVCSHFSEAADRVSPDAVEELRLRLFPTGTILFPKSGASTHLNHRVVLGTPAYVSSHLACITVDEARALPQFAFRMLTQIDSRDLTADQTYPSLRLSQIADVRIPLPPLDVQHEVVDEIEGYQRVIDGARMVVENWRPRIEVDPEWPVVELGEVFARRNGSVQPGELSSSIAYVRLEDIEGGTGFLLDGTDLGDASTVKSAKTKFYEHDILYGKLRPNLNKVWLSDREGICSTDIYALTPVNGKADPRYYAHVLRTPEFNDAAVARVSGAQLPRISWTAFATLRIPLPPHDAQRMVVARIAEEQTAVNANRDLMTKMEERVRDVVARVWN